MFEPARADGTDREMRSTLSGDDLASYVARQASAFFPDGVVSAGSLNVPVRSALDRLAPTRADDPSRILSTHLHADGNYAKERWVK